MHSPCCIRPYHCLECDARRAQSEIARLRGVLRVTMDELIAERAEVKDLSAKYAHYETELRRLQEGRDKAIASLWLTIRMVQQGKLSASEIHIPEEHR